LKPDKLHTDLSKPEEALQAANAALGKAIDKAEVTLTFLLGDDAKDMTIEKAEKALQLMDELVQKRKEAAKVARDPLPALALVEQEEKQQQLVKNVLSAMMLQQDWGRAVARSKEPLPAAVGSMPPKDLSPTNLDDPQEALKAAQAALDKALDKAEVILSWVLGADARDMTLEKAQKALAMLDGLVDQRKEAAKEVADPAQAHLMVEKAERKQLLVNNVVSAMIIKEDWERALGRATGTAQSSSSAASKTAPSSAQSSAQSKTSPEGTSPEAASASFTTAVRWLSDWWTWLTHPSTTAAAEGAAPR